MGIYRCDCDNTKGNIFNFNSSIKNFKRYFNMSIEEYGRCAVCLADIGNFRLYNYIFGYEIGDILLNMIVDRIQTIIGEMGCVLRFAGDVLLILLYKVSDRLEVSKIVEKIIKGFSDVFEISGHKIRALINIGISMYPEDGYEADTLIKYAEIALNNSKKLNTERYVFFCRDMYENVIKKGKVQIDVLNALCNNQFILYYQPQVDIDTMKIYGIEALLRWNHPADGILSPMNFIDIIEQNGMINEIGRFVLKEACREIKRLHNMGYCDLNISVNISEKQLEDDYFSDFIENVLKDTGLKAQYLTLEITERILINPSEKILNILSELKNKGIKIFIDDFGTGYSSLNYLYNLPINGIKIDKSFINKIGTSEKEYIIIKNIIKLAQELDLEVVAEGVEKKEQLDCLKSMKCSKIQGYIFGRPVETNKIQTYLKNTEKRQMMNVNEGTQHLYEKIEKLRVMLNKKCMDSLDYKMYENPEILDISRKLDQLITKYMVLIDSDDRE